MAKILAVDDEISILTVLKTLFTSQGHEVVAVSDGKKVLEMLNSNEQFDLVISDIRMNPVNGMQILAAVKEKRDKLPVLLITAFDSKETRQRAKDMGAAGYISKPFKIPELMAAAKAALEQKK